MTLPSVPHDLVGIRESRPGPLAFVAANGLRPALGDVVLVDLAGRTAIARVEIATDQIRLDPALDPKTMVRGTIQAVGADHPAVRAALAERDADALAAARQQIGARATVRSAHWSLDRARLDLVVEHPVEPSRLLDDLARSFQAEIRMVAQS